MSDGTAPRRRGLTKTHKRLLGGAGSIAIVVLVFVFVLPRIADYRDVLDVLRDLDWQDWAALAAAVLLNLATFPPPWMAALPGLGYREGMAMTQASTALSIVSPAGAAVGMAASYSMLRSWKFGASAVGLAVAITGVWNQFANLVFPVVALALLDGRQRAASGAADGCADRASSSSRSRSSASRSSSPARSAPAGSATPPRARGIACADSSAAGPVAWGGESFATLPRRTRSASCAGAGTSSRSRRSPGHLTVFVLLLVSLRVTGVTGSEVTVIEAFAAWALVRILGALPLTPAGVGIVEVGLTGALVAFGAPNAEAVAATLLYRALTVLPTLALGCSRPPLGAHTTRGSR